MNNQRIALLYALGSVFIYYLLELFTGNSYAFVTCILGAFIGARYGRCDYSLRKKIITASLLSALSFFVGHLAVAVHGMHHSLEKHHTTWIEIIKNGAAPQIIMAVISAHQWIYTLFGIISCALAVRFMHNRPIKPAEQSLINL